MLCSDCKCIIRPVVVLDIDGTLGNYHNWFQMFAERYLGRSLRDGYDGSCELHEWYDLSLDQYREIKLAYRQGGMKRSMPLYPDVVYMIATIRRHAEVWIATTRPYLRLDNIDPDTREWLRRNNISYDGMVYSEDKYSRLQEIVEPERVVCVYDDLPEMYLAARDIWGAGVPLLKAAVHNQYARRDARNAFSTVEGARGAKGAILSRLQAWQAVYA